MTRIVGGLARGRRLATPDGRLTRPTSDRVREALFNSLEADLGELEGRAFLDLYAGSGAVGLEALSRGAAPVVLVENDRRAAAVIKKNLAALADLPGATLKQMAVEKVVLEAAVEGGFDVIFADPPYALTGEQIATVLTGLLAAGGLAEDARIVVERATRSGTFAWPEGFEADRDRRYGDTTLWYGRTKV